MNFFRNYMLVGLTVAGLAGDAPLRVCVEDRMGPAAGPWRTIAAGVYERTEPDGATTRLTFGAAGAEHTRRALAPFLEQAEADARAHPRDTAAAQRLRALRRALDVATEGARWGGASPIIQELLSSGFMCGTYRYELETGRLRDGGGVSFAARTYFNPNPNALSSAPPAPAGVFFVATAGIQTSPSTFRTVAQSSDRRERTVPVELSAIDTLEPGAPAFSCAGFTSAQIFIASSACPGGGSYAALERVYGGC